MFSHWLCQNSWPVPPSCWYLWVGEESLTFLICKMGMVIPSRDSKVWAQGRSQSYYLAIIGFPDSSVDKESTCNAGHPSSIPGSGRSAGEGISYPLQYSWASLMACLVKNLPKMRETWVRSLDWEDPLEKGKVTHSRILGVAKS